MHILCISAYAEKVAFSAGIGNKSIESMPHGGRSRAAVRTAALFDQLVILPGDGAGDEVEMPPLRWKRAKSGLAHHTPQEPAVAHSLGREPALLQQFALAVDMCEAGHIVDACAHRDAVAVNGRQWDDIPRQTDALIREKGQDVDAILIFMGTNDFNAGVPTGEFFSEKREETEASTGMKNGDLRQMRLHRSFIMDGSTLAGRINIALSRLKDTYPDKQIVLITPVHRGYARFSDTNVQPDELWQNAAGQWFDEYVATVKKAGEIWSVPVVDLYSDSGYFPLSDAFTPYVHDKSTDRLHASDNGNRRFALTLLYRLLSLPCSLK